MRSKPLLNKAFIKKLYLKCGARVRPVDFQLLLAKSHT